jgi:hypothetical protein
MNNTNDYAKSIAPRTKNMVTIMKTVNPRSMLEALRALDVRSMLDVRYVRSMLGMGYVRSMLGMGSMLEALRTEYVGTPKRPD